METAMDSSVNETATSEKTPAAVIGSGFGGLAAAIRLQAKGYDTTIFEMRDMPGGRAYVYKDKGFTYDAGPTIITAPFMIDELFELAGKKKEDYVNIVPTDPFYNIVFHDGRIFEYTGDTDCMVEQIRKFKLLPKLLDHEDGELTATQKLKRSSMADMFAPLIEEMYSESS